MKCIFNRLPRLMEQQSIGLIIIDSIAGAFRMDSDAITRADNMRKLVFKLQTLADEHECAVVCVNQVEFINSAEDISTKKNPLFVRTPVVYEKFE